MLASNYGSYTQQITIEGALVWSRGHVGNVVPVRARVFKSLSRCPTKLTEPIYENILLVV